MLLMNKLGTTNFMVALLVSVGYAKVMGRGVIILFCKVF